MRNLILSIFFVLCLSLQAFAAEVIIVKGGMKSILTSASPRTANAMCFTYSGGDFKCACRFSDNSKVWASREINQIKGLGDGNSYYGNIEACKNAKLLINKK